MKWIVQLLALIFKWNPTPPPTDPMKPEQEPVSVSATENLYETAKKCLGTHQTLNPSVSPEVGCAEAVSSVLKLAGYQVPPYGIAGTADLVKWLLASPKFTRIYAPEEGAITVSPTGYGNGKIPGHTGIFGGYGVAFPGDWGIMSNDSQTGLLLELWSLSKWGQYYTEYGGIPSYYFRPL